MEAAKAELAKLAAVFKEQPWHDSATTTGLPVALALATHFVFSHGEPDNQMYLYILFCGFFYISLTYFLVASGNVGTMREALSVTSSAYVTYFATLFTSIFIYRAFFHRLKKYPGPFIARVTKFYDVALAVPKLRYYLEIEKLHKQYGDYIRVGPRDLSIADVNAVPLIHGVGSKCSKGVWYSNAAHIEGYSLHTTRDKKNHRERRRIWDKAFNVKVLHEYEPRINRHAAVLIQQLDEREGKTVRLSDWVNFYSFDVMGDIGFSKSFGMLEKGKEDKLIKKLHASMVPLGVFRDITWFMNLMLRVPILQKDLREFMQWSSDVLKERKKITPSEKDIFGYIMDPDEPGIPLHLNADARLVIVAGSDTTASTLTWLIYELCKDQSQLRKLQKAVDQIAAGKELLTCADLANFPLLDGYINEALRLHPAVPSGVQRETPPEGITIGDKYIPGNILIWQPIHTMQRDERYFKDGQKFMPERWLDEYQAEYVRDKRAFMPFSTGTYKCIGNNIAIMEMRVVTANLVRRFDIGHAPSEDYYDIENKTRDTFTLAMGKLDVVMTRRKFRKDSAI